MENSFKIYFSVPFFKNINEIIFRENVNCIYYDGSHMNYIYKLSIEEIEYTFNGFFKDNYFVIIFDSFDKNLQINIENKHVILFNLNWKKINYNDKEIYIINTDNFKNYKIECNILNIRKKLFDITNISLNDYLKIKNIESIECTISDLKYSNKKIFNKSNNLQIISKIKDLLNTFD